MSDVHQPLLRAMVRRWPDLRPIGSSSEPWASITFTGTRHRFVFAAGPDLAGLEDIDWALAGHVVADIVAQSQADRLIVEALTLDACDPCGS